MKTKVWISKVVEVDLNFDDLIETLSALPESEREHSILSAINTAGGILRRIPDARIAEMNDAQRKIIADALAHEVERYRVPVTAGSD